MPRLLIRLWKSAILWIMNSAGYSWLMRSVVPRIRFSTSYAAVNGFEYHVAYELLEPGDVIVTADPWKLTGLLVPGWDHVEICVGKYEASGDLFECAGMHADGYRKSTFFDVAKECSRFAILRPLASPPEIEWAIEKVRGAEGAQYDLLFELGVRQFYCSELALFAYEHCLEFDLEDIHSLGRKYLSPQGVFSCPGFEIIFEVTRD